MASRFASELADPSKVTVTGTVTFWLVPALATGAALAAEAVTVTAATSLFDLPSFTIKVST